ncbi:hypothetical protein CCR75_005381 [Bremia lactucae]|uniref:Uncharacterized protein n=1 Tax=Bremia lactucae TaxID=4779 RepID=A0A976FFF8_BRELC|nr:hypothetical protein CCR75_005381 [Bremia lactucae]
MQIEEIPRAVETCHAALLQGEMSVAQELCMPIGIDLVLLLLNLWLLLHYHRRWAKYVMVLMATMYLADVPCQLYVATFPAPAINHVEPTFALVYEELLVALNGINLKPGGSVAWVAYWGCATTSDVDACEKQFISTFEAGNVAVTFKSLDHFIPCYRDPPNPLKEQNFKCFKNIRIRVKNTESIPGWSRSVLQLSDVKVVNDKPNRIKKDHINRKAIVLKQGQQIDHDVSSPKDQNSRHAQPNEKVKIDTFSVIAFHQNKADKNEFGPKSFCKGAEVNNNGPQIKPKTRSEIIQSQTPKGVEVTFKASVKMPLIDVEMVKAATAIVATTVENLEEPKFEANKVLEGSLVDVKVDERQYHAPVIGSAIGQEATSTNEAVLLSSVINQDRTEISTMANKGRKRDENINAGAEINSPDTRSECMSTSGECNYNQKDMKEKSLDAVIVSRHPESGYKRRPASRRRMNRQTKKALGSAAIGR